MSKLGLLVFLFVSGLFAQNKPYTVSVYNNKEVKIGTWSPCKKFTLSSEHDYNQFENLKLCLDFMTEPEVVTYVGKGCNFNGVLRTTKEGQPIKNLAAFVPDYDAKMPYIILPNKKKQTIKYYKNLPMPGNAVDFVDVICPHQT